MSGEPPSSTRCTHEEETSLVSARKKCAILCSSRCFRRFYCVGSYCRVCRITVSDLVEWVSVRIFPLVIPKDTPQLYILTTYSLLVHCSSNSFVLVTMNKEVCMRGAKIAFCVASRKVHFELVHCNSFHCDMVLIIYSLRFSHGPWLRRVLGPVSRSEPPA